MAFPSAPSPVPAAPPRGGRVLVVDDDRLVLATLVHGLVQAGFEVIDADNGDDAILLARQHRPDLALLDIRMDGMSGFDVAEYLRDHLQIPFMFLSAFSDEATQAQIRALGALAYLVKPLDVGQIVPVVRQAFEKVQSRGPSSHPLGVPAASGPAAPPLPPVVDVPIAEAVASDLLDLVVPMAVGVLMHRYSLDRRAAFDRLQRLAQQEGRPLQATCASMVAAIEQLALPSGF